MKTIFATLVLLGLHSAHASIGVSSSTGTVFLIYSDNGKIVTRPCAPLTALGQTFESARTNCKNISGKEYLTSNASYQTILDGITASLTADEVKHPEAPTMQATQRLQSLRDFIAENCPGMTGLSKCQNVDRSLLDEFNSLKSSAAAYTTALAEYNAAYQRYAKQVQGVYSRVIAAEFTGTLNLSASEREIALTASNVVTPSSSYKFALLRLLKSIPNTVSYGNCKLVTLADIQGGDLPYRSYYVVDSAGHEYGKQNWLLTARTDQIGSTSFDYPDTIESVARIDAKLFGEIFGTCAGADTGIRNY